MTATHSHSVLTPPLPAAAVSWTGLRGPAASLAVARLAQQHTRLIVALAANEQHAYRLEQELRFFLGELPLVHLPDSEVLPYDQFSAHQEILSQRLSALHRLPQMRRGVLLTTADQLMRRLPPRGWLAGRAFDIKLGDKLDPQRFREQLIAAGYQSVSEVQAQGEFAVRGALLDLFPMGAPDAYRIDLFDDEIETIRTFDPETQRSEDKVGQIRLLPAREFPTDRDGIETFRKRYREYFPGDPSRSRIYAEVSKGLMPGGIESWLPLFFSKGTSMLTDYLPPDAVLVALDELERALDEDWQQIGERHERYSGDLERPLMKPEELFVAPAAVMKELGHFARATVGGTLEPRFGFAIGEPRNGADGVRAQLAGLDADEKLLFVAESAGRREALLGFLRPLGILPREHANWDEFVGDGKRFGITLGPLQEGFRLDADKLTLISEAQVFGQRAPAAEVRRKNRIRDPETVLRDLSEISQGSPVVHVQHGVGRYVGLVTLDAGGIETEYLVLEYAGGDKLYVPVTSLNLIHRYAGTEPEHAPLHGLGSDRWAKAQTKAREKAHDVAAELLQIQARRAAKPGMSLEFDEDDYARFADGFPFTSTPDQQKAIDAVLDDMRSDKTMDRVVCGDVGFGKTEVALRAAFVAARSGRQVCMLAPTTLLVEQHAKNFADRFADFPIRIASLSRLRTSKEQNQTLKELSDGKVDIVIGTHRLLQDDIRFKDLGLVVVDEEHRFGVRHKERLKNLRAEVDLLTLTATPIPRTLNMSLAGLRDLSIIATPPPSRVAIKTFVSEWSNALVYEACLRELKRGGQIYFLHNEVKDIEHFARKVQELVPEGRVRFAHGQMRERELEQVMLDFYHQRFNILVCTTIIESGIDVPSANTILIDRAEHLGLAQLHQLRGRVGRSHHRGYAYFLVPSKRALSADAQKRLDAIETLGDLGSGFALATHDLEIRGAGELLGQDQSGQIEEVGFTMYAELLARAVKAIQRGKLDDAPFGSSSCEIDLGVASLIPDSYVPDVHARLTLYKRIAEAADEATLHELKVEMIDRFGLLPPPAERLFDAAELRTTAQKLGITRLRAGGRSITIEFDDKPNIEPIRLIKLIQTQPRTYKLEGQKRLHCYGNFEAPEARVPAATLLLTTLGPV
ncbi:transcription-repair coupling factor [Solimonas terrae]|uniref:Transcription-repair-coupling factor n=1 Tax=Solimonas terrae TaxID=1396819 RepID=A0A6M2BQH7_9GAMM|nr:transcription-repair coupling factor [Solimonas terrae]NGY04465.1 transcription-repair coupling factor [Solimonas terrae]